MIGSFLVRSYFNYSGYLFRLFPGLLSLALPRTLVVEASNICMLKCPACATVNYSKRAKGMMSFDLFKAIIDSIDWKLKRINFSYAGEPLVNGDLFKMIAYAQAKGIDCIVETNGMLLEDKAEEVFRSGLRKLNVAFDGTNQEEAEKYRRGIDFEKVVRGIRKLVLLKKEGKAEYPHVHLQFIVMKHNQSVMEKASAMARELGADYIDFKSMILSGGTGLSRQEKEGLASDFLPDGPGFLRYEKKNGRWQMKRMRKGFCPHALSDSVIMYNGDVTVCTMDVQGDFIVGNIKEEPLRNIWRGDRYRRMRAKILRRSLPECGECGYLVSDFKSIRVKEA